MSKHILKPLLLLCTRTTRNMVLTTHLQQPFYQKPQRWRSDVRAVQDERDDMRSRKKTNYFHFRLPSVAQERQLLKVPINRERRTF